MIIFIICMLVAYLFGSLSSAIIICRICRLPDPRDEGSGNPGTTNVLRIAGKKVALWVLIGDFLKGLIPVLFAKAIHLPDLFIGWVALAAVIGHIFPLFFQFKGGKGVATAAGVLFALYWPLGLLVLFTWISTAVIFRYSSLAALLANLLAPIFAWMFNQQAFILPLSVLMLIIFWRHSENIQRLWRGTETKIGQKRI